MIAVTSTTFGATGLIVSSITCGAAGWQRRDDGSGSSEAESADLASALVSSPITMVDTSNNYGFGQSERRVGAARATVDGFGAVLVQTKADRGYGTNDFSRARMFASLDESRERLGLDVLPMVYLHDPENTTWEIATAADGPVAALVEARERGIISHLGISGGPADLLERFVRTGHFEALITHNRFTLVDRSADHLLSVARENGLGVMNAAPYGGGLLTAWPPPRTRYAYDEAPAALLASVEQIAGLATEFDVPLAALALHWSLRDVRIDSTIVGMDRVADLQRTIALTEIDIPDAAWEALDGIELDRSTWQDAM
ncbi:aldo/keto reductase [Agromyces intestinalis]|uniref:Aldo/keto reductase n=1 Tax=Agromyces intestinalis TaxID=2592652 RepID=A0A5C1YFX9_9MICO|nr:aldo/keto reductase [Agromyces intestinalis]QEO14445.1 aldo/keto reductase [Agromyces intestinalis]